MKKELATKIPHMRECARGVCNPQRKQGLRAPAGKGVHTLVNLKGPGVFVGAAVSKQGGATDLTFVDLTIDGKNVVNLSYAAAQNWGLTQYNPFGIVLLKTGAISNLTIGFPTPLRFEKELVLSVNVNEAGVVQILGNVVYGST